MSNTPKFDQALDAVLSELKPHQRTCTETGETFEIGEREIELCKTLRIPPPTTVWWANARKGLAYTAGLELFRRTLDDGASVVSMYDPGSPAKIIPNAQWYSEAFDPMAFDKDVDQGKAFFDQWAAFSSRIPRPAIVQDIQSENSEWSVYSNELKNCYANFIGVANEDQIYSDGNGWTKHSVLCAWCMNCEWCYECVSCHFCNGCAFCERCDRCVDVLFSLACKDCSDCFGCTNLRKKKFCFMNQQLTEEEYRERMSAIDLTDAAAVEEWRQRTGWEWDEAPRPASLFRKSESVVGDDIENSHDVLGITIVDSERVYESSGVVNGRDSWRMTFCLGCERSCQSIYANKAYENRMVSQCNSCIDVEYSELLTSCEHCFGCFGLSHKSYCIFNRQYTPEEYWRLVDGIKTRMLQEGTYGERFPYQLSPFAYNASFANGEYPTDEEEATRLGSRWYDFAQETQMQAHPIEDLPTGLEDTTDAMLQEKYRCPETGRAFGFIKPQIAFHRERGYALPRVHPIVRRMSNVAALFPFRLWGRKCSRCSKDIQTRIPPTHPSPILCQTCYEQEVHDE